MLYVVGVVTGVTYLDNIMYVVCWQSSTIRLYNMDTYTSLDVVIDVDGMNLPIDMVVSRDDHQLFIADYSDCVWRVSVVDHTYVKWLTSESTGHRFNTLSLTSRRLLVTSFSRRLLHYDTTDTTAACRWSTWAREPRVSRSWDDTWHVCRRSWRHVTGQAAVRSEWTV